MIYSNKLKIGFLSLFLMTIAFLFHINFRSIVAKDSSKKDQLQIKREEEFSRLELKTTQGKVYKNLHQHEKIIVLNFWASWCAPCKSEFKDFNAILKDYSDKLEVIGVNNDSEDAEKLIKKTTKEYNLAFESVVESEYNLATKFKVTQIPTTLVFKKGKLIFAIEKKYQFQSEEFMKFLK